MKKLALVAIGLVTLAGCAQLPEPSAAGGASYQADGQRPDWLRNPGRNEYPYNPRGW